MNRNQSTAQIGRSTGPGYTPAGDKKSQPVDVSQTICCELTGPGVDRPTTLFVRPERLTATVAKYAALGQRVSGPGIQSGASVGAVPVGKHQPAKADKTVDRHGRTGNPVIDLNTGTFYGSAKAAGTANKLSSQLVAACLTGKIHTAKGHSFRKATPEEIANAGVVPGWKFAGPLVDMAKRK